MHVLLTAFEPYGQWATNASWLCLMECTRQLPASPKLTTRLYPVDFSAVPQRLASDLQGNFDFALHLGQAPGSSAIRLEEFALNVGGEAGQASEEFAPLCADGPAALASQLPLPRWSHALRRAGIPATVSFHAGTYLCNATLYWSRYLSQQMGLATRSAFLHLPLETSQVLAGPLDQPSLPAATTAHALRLILEQLEASGDV